MSVSAAGIAGPTEIQTLTNSKPSRGPWRRRRQGEGPRPWRVSILVLAGLFYLVPLACSFKFSLLDQSGGYGFGNYTDILHNSALLDALYLSLEIAALTAVLVILLVLPTTVLVRLKLPKMTIVMDIITILPIVVPPIVLAAGLSEMQESAPLWMVKLFFNHPITCLVPIYTVLAMPLVYRSISNGLRAIDLHTLVEAARSLGCGWPSTLFRVVLPNVQTAVLGGMFLTIAIVLGEVVISSQMLYTTFPVQMLETAQSENTPGIPVALSLVALLFTFLLLFSLTFLARRHGRTSTR
jgi:putative spermidine/putrescine transport system permease protein